MECSISLPNYQEDLMSCMYQLQQKAVHCDSSLECKDGVIFVHKLVLLSCGSPHLQQHMTGNHTGSCINISLNEFSLKSVCVLVQTLYTGDIKIFQENISEFISLCNFLGLDKIASHVESIQKKKETVDKSEDSLTAEKDATQDEMLATGKDVTQDEMLATEKDVTQHEMVATEKDVAQNETMATEKDMTQDEIMDSTCDETDKLSNVSAEEITPEETDKNQQKRGRKLEDQKGVSKKIKLEEGTDDESSDITQDSFVVDQEGNGTEESLSNAEEMLQKSTAKQSSSNTKQNEDNSLDTDMINYTCRLCKKVFISSVIDTDDPKKAVCKSCKNLFSGKNKELTKEETKADNTTKKSKETNKSTDKMTAAYEAVLNDGIAVRAAARQFGVAPSTLRDRIKKKGAEVRQRGTMPVLDAQVSEKLVEFLKIFLKLGYMSTREEVCTVGSHLAISLGKRPRNRPLTKHWFYFFCERYPEIKQMRTHLQQLQKTQSEDPSHVSNFFKYFISTMTKYEMQDKPSLIFSLTSVDVANCPPYVIDESNIHEEMDKITIIVCANGSGDIVHPFFVFPEDTKNLDSLQNDCSPGSGYVADESLYECEVFLKYLTDHFSKHTPEGEQKILLVDGHKMFLSQEVMEWADKHNLTIVLLPAKPSKQLQPVEGELLDKFEQLFRKKCKKESTKSTGLDRVKLCNAVNTAYTEAFAKENIEKAFQKSGIIPVNEHVCE